MIFVHFFGENEGGLMKEQIGQRLKQLIKENGISNVEIIKQTGISKNILSNYYKGEIPNNIITLAKISQILGSSLDYIIFGDETTNYSNK